MNNVDVYWVLDRKDRTSEKRDDFTKSLSNSKNEPLSSEKNCYAVEFYKEETEDKSTTNHLLLTKSQSCFDYTVQTVVGFLNDLKKHKLKKSRKTGGFIKLDFEKYFKKMNLDADNTQLTNITKELTKIMPKSK